MILQNYANIIVWAVIYIRGDDIQKIFSLAVVCNELCDV
jgi:hypothetical protein